MKTCPICGGIVSVFPAKRRYCSDRCKNRAAYLRTHTSAALQVATCVQCGEALPEQHYACKRYCSNNCRQRAWQMKQREAGRPPRKKHKKGISTRKRRLLEQWEALVGKRRTS